MWCWGPNDGRVVVEHRFVMTQPLHRGNDVRRQLVSKTKVGDTLPYNIRCVYSVRNEQRPDVRPKLTSESVLRISKNPRWCLFHLKRSFPKQHSSIKIKRSSREVGE